MGSLADEAATARHGDKLVDEVCSHLWRVRAVLDASLAREPPTIAMPFGNVGAVGFVTLEVVQLLTTLVRSSSETVLQEAQRERLLPVCLDIFFRHPWCSILHNSVAKLLSEVLASSSTAKAEADADDGGGGMCNAKIGDTEGADALAEVRLCLVEDFLWDGGFLQRAVEEFRLQREYAPRSPPRVGYMGQLVAMCADVSAYSSRVPKICCRLQKAEGWEEYAVPALMATKLQLGGGERVPRRVPRYHTLHSVDGCPEKPAEPRKKKKKKKNYSSLTLSN
eukprot:NODE_16012_length_1017_cov_4.326966.p1 GENE.NODE_16012_length_1017_cov_4.326966~~NODE_16012_length_1017_cov_4.326966.p1  ORF type:complete len:280 (-),score=96.76 NODE_16012_length_1017_cov_4.326966:146-985(-)